MVLIIARKQPIHSQKKKKKKVFKRARHIISEDGIL